MLDGIPLICVKHSNAISTYLCAEIQQFKVGLPEKPQNGQMSCVHFFPYVHLLQLARPLRTTSQTAAKLLTHKADDLAKSAPSFHSGRWPLSTLSPPAKSTVAGLSLAPKRFAANIDRATPNSEFVPQTVGARFPPP